MVAHGKDRVLCSQSFSVTVLQRTGGVITLGVLFGDVL